MNIRPIKDLVVTEKLAQEQTGTIIIPEQAHRTDRYRVLAVGPDVRELVPGDIVHIHPTAESAITSYNGRVLRHVREKNINAVEL
jgi:co-chaperonin GroES (HSP10)